MAGFRLVRDGKSFMAGLPPHTNEAAKLLHGYGISSGHDAIENSHGVERKRGGRGKRGFAQLLCLAYFAMALLKLAMSLPYQQQSRVYQQGPERGGLLVHLEALTTPFFLIIGMELSHPFAALCLHAILWIPCYMQAGLSAPFAASRAAMINLLFMVVPAVLLYRGVVRDAAPVQHAKQQAQQAPPPQSQLSPSEAPGKPKKQHSSNAEDDTREQLKRVQLSLQQRRPKYVTHFRQHKVALKVPGHVEPNALPAGAVPHLASLVRSESTSEDVEVISAAMRAGCILLTLELASRVPPQGNSSGGGGSAVAGEGGAGAASRVPLDCLVASAAEKWLQQTGLAAQVPESLPVVLQMAGRACALQWRAHCLARAWEAVPQPQALKPFRLTSNHTALLPAPCPVGGLCSSSPAGSTLSVHTTVDGPAGAQFLGWGPGAHDSHQQGGSASHVLASAWGQYLPTRVQQTGNCSEGPRALQVAITVPADPALHARPSPLHLELWQGDVLLAHSTLLLLPASMAAAAAEVQGMPPCTPTRGTDDMAEFRADLGRWLYQSHATCSPKSEQQQQQQQQQQQEHEDGSCGAAWDVGAGLARQAVLWGLPALATLLVDTLMTLPCAPAMPLAQLAHTPHTTGDAGAAGNAGLAQEADSLSVRDLGGLLHLSLLSPRASCTLAAVLALGRRWGSRDVGFAWRWDECSAAGLTPQGLLACQPCEVQQLAVRLGGAAGAAALHGPPGGCALPTSGGSNTAHAAAAPSCSGAAFGGGSADAGSAPCPKATLSGSSSSSSSSSGCTGILPMLTPLAPRWCRLVASSMLGAQDLFARHACCTTHSDGSCSTPSCDKPWSSSRRPLAAALHGGSNAQLAADPGGWSTMSGASVTPAGMLSRVASEQGEDRQQADQWLIASNEAHFRRWVNEQSAPTLKGWCTCMGANVGVSLLRASWANRLLIDLPTEAIMGIPYITAAVVLRMSLGKSKTEMLVVLILLSRFMAVSLIGFDLVAWPPSFRNLLNLRVEVLLEVIVAPIFEQVRVPVLLALRALLVIGYGIYYRRAMLAHPWQQACLLHLCSVVTGVVMDLRWRALFMNACLRQELTTGTIGKPAKAKVQ